MRSSEQSSAPFRIVADDSERVSTRRRVNDREIQKELHELDAEIWELEKVVKNPRSADPLASQLRTTLRERAALKLLQVNRRQSARQPVVDLASWRDGDGALYLTGIEFS